MAPRPQSIVAQRFGRLVAMKAVEKPAGVRPSLKSKSGWWLCVCDCGERPVVYITDLRSGATQSCGCLAREMSSERNSTHHMKGSLTYASWQAMRTRCLNKRAANYRHYGGRGIRICERWDSFENFLADMGPRPSSIYSLDRFPDNNGNYEPGNCRWATPAEQNNNRRPMRRRKKSESAGVR